MNEAELKALSEKIDLECKNISNEIGTFRTGEEFVDRASAAYNDTSKVKRIGLAFNRLLKANKELFEKLHPVEPNKPNPPLPTPVEQPQPATDAVP